MYYNVTKALLAPQACSTAPLVVLFRTAGPCVDAVFYFGHCVAAPSCGSYVGLVGGWTFQIRIRYSEPPVVCRVHFAFSLQDKRGSAD